MKDIHDLSDDDLNTIMDIALRAFDLCVKHVGYSNTYSVSVITRILILVHLNNCKLRLKDMLVGNDIDLVHDIGGILNNYNGNLPLKNCFLPRFADLS